VTLPIDPSRAIELSGRIDRIDVRGEADREVIDREVIDYKARSHRAVRQPRPIPEKTSSCRCTPGAGAGVTAGGLLSFESLRRPGSPFRHRCNRSRRPSRWGGGCAWSTSACAPTWPRSPAARDAAIGVEPTCSRCECADCAAAAMGRQMTLAMSEYLWDGEPVSHDDSYSARSTRMPARWSRLARQRQDLALVGRSWRLLRPARRPAQILAITFQRAGRAADAARLLQDLAALARADPDDARALRRSGA